MLDNESVIFISDLHLDEHSPHITAQFLALLANCRQPQNTTLYILGDFFEAWIGDDDVTDFHQTIIAALKQATDKGLSIYIMHGNRDFLLGKKFCQATGCQLLPDTKKIDAFGHSILLLHGDTLCTQDIHYLRARKWFRNPLMQRIFLLLPLSFRRYLANQARAKSKAHISETPYAVMDVTQHEVERVMREKEVDVLIHGHTHKPAIHTFDLDGKPVERIVLSAWHDEGKVLIWDQSGKKVCLVSQL